jgi:hypothetical protein
MDVTKTNQLQNIKQIIFDICVNPVSNININNGWTYPNSVNKICYSRSVSFKRYRYLYYWLWMIVNEIIWLTSHQTAKIPCHRQWRLIIQNQIYFNPVQVSSPGEHTSYQQYILFTQIPLTRLSRAIHYTQTIEIEMHSLHLGIKVQTCFRSAGLILNNLVATHIIWSLCHYIRTTTCYVLSDIASIHQIYVRDVWDRDCT